MRRMMEHFSHQVVALRRTKIGNLDLNALNLPEGEYRRATEADLALVFGAEVALAAARGAAAAAG